MAQFKKKKIIMGKEIIGTKSFMHFCHTFSAKTRKIELEISI